VTIHHKVYNTSSHTLEPIANTEELAQAMENFRRGRQGLEDYECLERQALLQQGRESGGPVCTSAPPTTTISTTTSTATRGVTSQALGIATTAGITCQPSTVASTTVTYTTIGCRPSVNEIRMSFQGKLSDPMPAPDWFIKYWEKEGKKACERGERFVEVTPEGMQITVPTPDERRPGRREAPVSPKTRGRGWTLYAASLGVTREQMDCAPAQIGWKEFTKWAHETSLGQQKKVEVKVEVVETEEGVKKKIKSQLSNAGVVEWSDPPYPLVRKPDITKAFEVAAPILTQNPLAEEVKPLGLMGNEYFYRCRPPRRWADEETHAIQVDKRENGVWKMPPGINLAACIHAVRQGDTDPEHLIYGLEGRVELALGRAFDKDERETLNKVLTIAAATRRDMGSQLFAWAIQFGHASERGYYHVKPMQNIVEIISAATRWRLDEKMLAKLKAIPDEDIYHRLDPRPRVHEYGDESDVHTDFLCGRERGDNDKESSESDDGNARFE